MIRIISYLLILINFYFGISHGSRTFQKPSAEHLQMMTSLGITDNIRIMIGVWAILSAVLILFPKIFFVGNFLQGVLLLLIMFLALKAGNYKFAILEIPFLLIPLILFF